MLGLISGGPQSDPEVQARRGELTTVSTGDVLGAATAQGFAESPGPRLARAFSRGYVDQGDGTYTALNAEDELGLPTGQLPPSPMVPVDVLKREYDIPGVLSFDKDTPQSVAQSLYDYKRAQMIRADTISRADNMLTQGMAARFVASMLGSLADPINLAAMFVPGINEASIARMTGVAAGAGAGARAAVRAGAGASAGAFGMAALEPLNYLLSQQDRDDWTMTGALANVLLGTVAGAGIHSGLGALTERARGLPDWAPARVAAERLQRAPPEVQQAIARHAVAATAEGRPIEAAALLDLHTALERDAAALRGEIAALPRTGMDQATAERVQAIDTELEAKGLTAKRRADLEAERAMVMDGVDPAIAELEQARTDAQRLGLERAAERAEGRAADAERQLDEMTRPGLPEQTATPAPGMVRLFHGAAAGDEAGVTGGRWVSDNLAYAQGYAGRGDGGKVYFIDLPENHPLVQANRQTAMVEGTEMRAPLAHFELPPEMAAQMQEVRNAPGPTARQSFDRIANPPIDPAAGQPPPPASRTGLAPPDPKPPSEPGAAARNLAEQEKAIAAQDTLIRLSKNEALAERVKAADARIDEEAKMDAAVFETVANCLVRPR